MNKIQDKIRELRNEAFAILETIDKLSDKPERNDLCSPKETAWRKVNRIYGKIESLQWVLEEEL